VGGVAGGSAQRKYEDLSRSWRRSMRKRFWVMGGVMAPMVAAFAAMGVIWENLRWASGFLIGCFFAMFVIMRMSPPGWIEKWQDGAWGEQWTGNVLRHVGQGHRTGQPEGSGVGDGGQPIFHFLGEDQVRVEAFEPEQDGGHGAVAVAGCGQRTVEVDPHGPHSVELSRGLEFLGKGRGGPHGAHGV